MIRLIVDKTLLIKSHCSLNNFRNLLKFTNKSKEVNVRQFNSVQNASNSSSQSSAKDIVLFRYENLKVFRLINLFGTSQLFFWVYMGTWAFYDLRNVKVSEDQMNDEDLAWWRKINLGEEKYRYSIAFFCFAVGYLFIFSSWMYTLRSVRYLIARKNGKDISIVCYTPLGRNRIMDVPIKCISAQESRQTTKGYLPLKVKNRMFYYILDMKGEFKNTKLFDSTAGLSRKF
ncbi:CLUMA_CG002497, isoform A [Clunio marinus]|uniref:CLUMA_CG002497, isoform A n=1 Tax=Clunio marinus TaxID=568069 RepID=A0A1J1HRC9_9DIPT|nr:CLUMA_CG002497, isoform A [Clunio marinus]